MKIANLRFYSGDGTGGAGTPQAGNSDSQADKSETTKTTDAVQDTDTDDDATAAKIKRANDQAAKYRTDLRQAEERLLALEKQVEEASTASMTEAERFKAANAKLTEQLKTEKLARAEAERLSMAKSSAFRYDIPEEFLPALRGDTQDEVDEAAKSLQKVFLAQAKKLAQVIPPNPEGGDKSGLTHAANGKATEAIQEKNNREYAKAF